MSVSRKFAHNNAYYIFALILFGARTPWSSSLADPKANIVLYFVFLVRVRVVKSIV